MKQIKASEVKPGMTIQFDLEGWDVKGTVGSCHGCLSVSTKARLK